MKTERERKAKPDVLIDRGRVGMSDGAVEKKMLKMAMLNKISGKAVCFL